MRRRALLPYPQLDEGAVDLEDRTDRRRVAAARHHVQWHEVIEVACPQALLAVGRAQELDQDPLTRLTGCVVHACVLVLIDECRVRLVLQQQAHTLGVAHR